MDRSERGHYLIELIAEKQKQDLNNNSLTEEPTDCVAVLQLEDPQGKVLKRQRPERLELISVSLAYSMPRRIAIPSWTGC